MAASNDRYLDLVARTAADQHAAVEITGLAEQAAWAAQTFRETLQRAILAAEALALPESRKAHAEPASTGLTVKPPARVHAEPPPPVI